MVVADISIIRSFNPRESLLQLIFQIHLLKAIRCWTFSNFNHFYCVIRQWSRRGMQWKIVLTKNTLSVITANHFATIKEEFYLFADWKFCATKCWCHCCGRNHIQAVMMCCGDVAEWCGIVTWQFCWHKQKKMTCQVTVTSTVSSFAFVRFPWDFLFSESTCDVKINTFCIHPSLSSISSSPKALWVQGPQQSLMKVIANSHIWIHNSLCQNCNLTICNSNSNKF